MRWIIERKVYQTIGSTRKLFIIVCDENENELYLGQVDEAPKDIRDTYYYKVDMTNHLMTFYVYAD